MSLYTNHSMQEIVISWLMESVLFWPKVIPLSSAHCMVLTNFFKISIALIFLYSDPKMATCTNSVCQPLTSNVADACLYFCGQTSCEPSEEDPETENMNQNQNLNKNLNLKT